MQRFQVGFLQIKFHYRQLFTYFSKSSDLLGSKRLPNFGDQLMNQLPSSMLVTQMRPHRPFGHLSDHDTHQPIENAWMDKKLLKRIVRVASVRVDVLQ